MCVRKIRDNQLTSSTSLLRVFILAASVTIVTACGGGSGDTQPINVTHTETQPLDHLSNLELQRAASVGSKQMQSGMNNAQGFAARTSIGDAMDSASLIDLQRLLGMSGESSSVGGSVGIGADNSDATFFERLDDDEEASYPDDEYVHTDNEEHVGFDSSTTLWEETGIDSLIDATLGLAGDADIKRDGNSMTINPDDSELCLQLDADLQNYPDEWAFCLAMMADVSVRIDGQTEDSGNISYLFQDETVLQVDYAPGQTLFKLRLPGVGRVFQKAAQLNPQIGSMPEVFEGVVELGTRIDNETMGAETGAMHVSVTAPIAIQHSESGLDMRVAASNLLHFEHNNALGTASIELDAKASQLTLIDEQTIEFRSNGSSIKIDLINDGDLISVSKLGFGNGPLSVTVDSVEVINMTLDTFGFNIDTLAQQLVLTDSLNFHLMVNLFGGLVGDGLGDESLFLEVSANAPTQASFTTQDNGSVRLDDAGPFITNWSASFGGEAESANFMVSPGECFTEGTDGNALFSQVVCQ